MVLGLLIQVEALLKAINTSAGVYQLLLTGEERMALGADFNADVFLCGTGLNHIATSAFDGCGLVFWMNSFFHFRHLFRNTSFEIT